MEIESLDKSDNPLHNVNILVKILTLYQAQMQVVIDEVFYNDYRRFAKKRLKIKKSRSGFGFDKSR